MSEGHHTRDQHRHGHVCSPGLVEAGGPSFPRTLQLTMFLASAAHCGNPALFEAYSMARFVLASFTFQEAVGLLIELQRWCAQSPHWKSRHHFEVHIAEAWHTAQLCHLCSSDSARLRPMTRCGAFQSDACGRCCCDSFSQRSALAHQIMKKNILICQPII